MSIQNTNKTTEKRMATNSIRLVPIHNADFTQITMILQLTALQPADFLTNQWNPNGRDLHASLINWVSDACCMSHFLIPSADVLASICTALTAFYYIHCPLSWTCFVNLDFSKVPVLSSLYFLISVCQVLCLFS